MAARGVVWEAQESTEQARARGGRRREMQGKHGHMTAKEAQEEAYGGRRREAQEQRPGTVLCRAKQEEHATPAPAQGSTRKA